MASESRRLVFSGDELVSAALEFCQHDRIPLPDAEVEGIELGGGATPTVVLCFRVDCPMEPDRVVLDGEQLVEALVRFCKRHEIPLPNSPEKHLSRSGDEIAMAFELKHRARCHAAVLA